MDSFYHTYPSTTINNGREQPNTLSRFSIKLPEKIRLEGLWGIGLASISLPLSFYTFDETKIGFFKLNKRITWTRHKIPSEFIFTRERLIEHINTHLSFPYAEYKYRQALISENVHSKKLVITPGCSKAEGQPFKDGDIFYPYFESHTWELLGFKAAGSYMVENVVSGNKRELSHYALSAAHSPDLSGGVHNIYLYCNLVKPTIVGDTYSALLRTIDIPPYRNDTIIGETVFRSYETPQFYPLDVHEFDSVEFELRASDGRLINFQTGEVIVTVQFKKLADAVSDNMI